MKHLLIEILNSILKTDKNLYYQITCESEDLVALTRNTSLSCNQKEGDKYEGINAVDEGLISIFKKFKESDEEIGGIYWTNWNDGAERVVDYHTCLDDMYGISKTIDKWEKDYERL